MSAAWVGFGTLPHVLGWTALFFVATVIVILGRRHPRIGVVLFTAFLVRAAAALCHVYIAPLPDGGADAVGFERLAWDWASNGFFAAFDYFPGINAYFYSWLMSLVYALTDRSVLMLQSLSVLAGVLGVYAAWRLGLEIWGEKSAKKATWVVALFPTVVQYGALPMRETWVVLFFLMGLIGVARWAKGGGSPPAAGGIAAFIAAGFFHTGLLVAALAFLMLMAGRAIRRVLAGATRGSISAVSVGVLFVVTVFLVGYLASGLSIPKLGSPEEIMDMSRLIDRAEYFASRKDAGARYPDWTVPATSWDLVWAVPVRSAYLLFSPFPWDVRTASHFIGVFDAVLYFMIVFFAWRNRHRLWSNPASRAIFLLLIPLIVVFGMGTGNFGTGLRHRGKFVAALIVLAAPRFPRLGVRAKRTLKETGAVARPRAAYPK